MVAPATNKPLVIGLAGSFGSGCTYVADHILVPRGYKKLSLSDVLREHYRDKKGPLPDTGQRRALQDFGDELRQTQDPDFLAQKIVAQIDDKGATEKWVVDSIRNPAETHLLRNSFPRFFLFGVYAEKQTRWGRVQGVYKGNRREFDEDDSNDTGDESEPYGQRVAACFYEADVVLANNSNFDAVGNEAFEGFRGWVESYVGLVEKPLERKQPIHEREAPMAMASAASQQSSCMKRKVGAVIVDGAATVISSGFNEVPRHGTPCKKKFRKCQRDFLFKEFADALRQRGFTDEGKEELLVKFVRRSFKMLDYCQALHAEENAIVALARNGSSVPLDQCTLYTTTYPCRLCANKIVNLGIRKVVYLEPYPDEEAKLILKRDGVDDEFYQGVTCRAYFRVYGEEK